MEVTTLDGQTPRATQRVQNAGTYIGTDCSGQIFSTQAVTVNVNQRGAELCGVEPRLNLDDIIGLNYGKNRANFRVKWVGAPDTPRAGQVGLLNLSPEKAFWDFPLPQPIPDNYQAQVVQKRKHPRIKCQNSVELHTESGASFWAKIADLSIGGCYIEMEIPLQAGTKVKVGIWFGESKFWADCEVACSAPGFGVGVKFTKISDSDLERIKQFLASFAPFAKKPSL